MRRTSGISLMLLIFLSLCLIIFSLLSLSGAVADETLSSQAADRTTEYYAAVSSANDLLSRIDEYLSDSLQTVVSDSTQTDSTENSEAAAQEQEDTYIQLCSQISESIPEVSWQDGTITFSVNVSGDQILDAALDISWPSSEEDPLYRIHTWKIVNTGEWTADNSMNLFRMGSDTTE